MTTKEKVDKLKEDIASINAQIKDLTITDDVEIDIEIATHTKTVKFSTSKKGAEKYPFTMDVTSVLQNTKTSF